MKIFLLPEDVRNGILQYMYAQPYQSVARGIALLEGLQEVPAAEPPKLPRLSTVTEPVLPPG